MSATVLALWSEPRAGSRAPSPLSPSVPPEATCAVGQTPTEPPSGASLWDLGGWWAGEGGPWEAAKMLFEIGEFTISVFFSIFYFSVMVGIHYYISFGCTTVIRDLYNSLSDHPSKSSAALTPYSVITMSLILFLALYFTSP